MINKILTKLDQKLALLERTPRLTKFVGILGFIYYVSGIVLGCHSVDASYLCGTIVSIVIMFIGGASLAFAITAKVSKRWYS